MNIFENAKFGDPYKTINGNKVFFLHRLDDGSVSCLVGSEKNYGFSILEEDEIESRWQESISEEELDSLANEDFEADKFTNIPIIETVYKSGFKAGYSKAKGL